MCGIISERERVVNPLYDLGFTRCGCIGCPLAGKGRYKEFALFPHIECKYKAAFGKYLERKEAKGNWVKKGHWEDAESMFKWWMEDETIPGQLELKDIFPEQFGA